MNLNLLLHHVTINVIQKIKHKKNQTLIRFHHPKKKKKLCNCNCAPPWLYLAVLGQLFWWTTWKNFTKTESNSWTTVSREKGLNQNIYCVCTSIRSPLFIYFSSLNGIEHPKIMLEKKKKFTTSLSTVSIILYVLFTFFNSHIKYKMNVRTIY